MGMSWKNRLAVVKAESKVPILDTAKSSTRLTSAEMGVVVRLPKQKQLV